MTQVLDEKDLKEAEYLCSRCAKEFPCLMSLNAHSVAKHRRNLLSCSNPEHGHRTGAVLEYR